MAQLIDLKTLTDTRGNLTVIEKILPFEIKRIFYIYGVDDSVRGKHRHVKTIQGAVCIQGSCTIYSNDGTGSGLQKFLLDKPSTCLLLEPQDWHYMEQFSKDAILMVFASEYYDKEDYIFEPYNN
jgi:dTDP-4-dehydrorhamnose 3,5-epimerase-like enzyme